MGRRILVLLINSLHFPHHCLTALLAIPSALTYTHIQPAASRLIPSIKNLNTKYLDDPPTYTRKMLAKATCVSLHTLALVLSIRPPASSTNKEKADKVKDEGLFTAIMINIMPHFSQSAAVVATAIYILMMSRGHISGELKPWQVFATVSGVLGYLLRAWSFRTLDRFFTVSNRAKDRMCVDMTVDRSQTNKG
jgi:hypothetical protein